MTNSDERNEKPKESKDSWSEIGESVPDWVSLSGIKQSVDSSVPIWWRGIWMVIIIGGLVFSGLQIFWQVSYYLDRPITVRISMKPMTELKFPPVTFCNFNPARMSALVEHNLTHLAPFFGRGSGLGIRAPVNSGEREHSDTSMDWEILYKDLAHQLEDMLVECEWKNARCNVSHFETTYSDAGVCYTFNSDGSQLVQTSGSGGGAFKVLLNIQQFEYLPDTVLAGVEVLIQEQDQPHLVSDYGVRVPVGTWTNIVIHKQVMVHIPPPFENCNEARDGHVIGRQVCNFKCYSEAVIRNCSCRLLYMTKFPSVRICSPSEALFCASIVTGNIRRGYDECAGSCKKYACTEEEFDEMTSEAPFSENFLEKMTGPLNMARETVKNNLVGFEVYYKDMAEERITSMKAYSPMDLFCDIGGALGLVLGASIATVLECIDFFLRRHYKLHYKQS